MQWVEENIPFSGEVKMQGAEAEMIPAIGMKLVHREIEEKPDPDGELRELSVDAVIELDVRLYEEQELELLQEHQIPFEVVPGVTSPIAVPAYNGIPVTHRDYCSSVHIITGHKKAGQQYNINFKALVETKGTLVFSWV